MEVRIGEEVGKDVGEEEGEKVEDDCRVMRLVKI